MKNLLKKLPLVFVVLSLTFSATVSAQFWGEKGNGNIQKQNREISSFSAISSSSGLDVYLRQSDKESVTVETDENLMEYIITRVKGDELILKIDGNIRRATKMNVYVNFIDINKLSISSGSDVESNGVIKASKLDITVSSGADAKLELDGEEISCSVSSGADANLVGKANFFYGKASSGSDLRAKGLTAKACKAKASSGGNVTVWVEESIEANASSGGDVNYYGGPEKVNTSSSSGGDVNRR